MNGYFSFLTEVAYSRTQQDLCGCPCEANSFTYVLPSTCNPKKNINNVPKVKNDLEYR